MQRRGSYGFDVNAAGSITCCARNAQLLRRLLVDWSIIDGDGGPGTESNGIGAWHLFCHLAAGAAIFRSPTAWAGLTYDARRRSYSATLCCKTRTGIATCPIVAPQAARLLRRAEWAGYVEGASHGRILHRGARDRGDPSTTDRRQDYDRDPDSTADGGPVWELWSASRDICTPGRPGYAIVRACVELISVLGGSFAGTIARGRAEPEYGHLRQMCAMIDAGLISVKDALRDTQPVVIPQRAEKILMDATPTAFARAAAELGRLRRTPAYYMYRRKITSFASASLLRRLARTLSKNP